MKAITIPFPQKYQNTATYYSNDQNEKEIKKFSADKAISTYRYCTDAQHCKPTGGTAFLAQ